jgi:hypothetical protein
LPVWKNAAPFSAEPAGPNPQLRRLSQRAAPGDETSPPA